MRKLVVLKLVLGAIGCIVFLYGVRSADSRLRWVAVAFLVAAFLLRFLSRRPPKPPAPA